MAYPDAENDWRNFLDADPEWEQLAEGLPPLVRVDERIRSSRVAGATLGVFDSLLVDRDPRGQRDVLDHLEAALHSALPLPPLDLAPETIGMTACAVLLAATGYDLDPRPILLDRLNSVLEQEADIWTIERTSLALACLACGLDDRVAHLLGVQSGLYEPGAEFGPDADSFIRCAVVATSAGEANFAPTWRSFCDFWPAHFQSGGLSLPDLLFAAFAVYTRIYGLAPGDVFARLHADVREIASG